MNQSSSASGTKKKYNHRRKNNRSRFNKNKSDKDGAPQSGQSNNNRRRQNKNRRPKSLSPTRIIQKYDNLLDQHLVSRKKYFDAYGRIQGKQLEKIINNYERTLKELRNFESQLKDWQKDVLNKKINSYPEDRQFSTEHNLEATGELVPFDGDFGDIHLLATQVDHEFKGDTEESSGSMQDYYSYKGITPKEESEPEEKKQ